MIKAPIGGRTGWYHGWNIVAMCIVASVAASTLPLTGFSLFLESWSKDLHVPFSTLALGITEFGLGCAVLSPFTGLVTDRLPARIILSGGVAGVALFCITVSYVTHVWQYLALYAVLLPVSVLASTTIPANAVVMRWFVRRRGLALGLTSMGLSIAGVVMPPILAALMPHFGWRIIWRLTGIIIAVVVLPLMLLVIRDCPTEQDGLHYITAAGTVRPCGHGAAGLGSSSLRWQAILARRNFWMLVAGYATMLIMYGGAGYNLAPIAASRGINAQLSSYLLSAWALSQTVATLAGGMLSDKFGNRLPLAGLTFLTAAGGVVLAFGANLPLLILGALLIGVGGGFWPLIASALAAEFGAANFGRAIGTLMLFSPSSPMAAFLVAKSKEATGSYAPALLGFTVAAVIGCICCLCMREEHGGRLAPQKAVQGEEATLPMQ